jgi:hypothetical protein
VLIVNMLNADDNLAVRRLAAVCLSHGSPERQTIVLLEHLADDDEQPGELRAIAQKVAQTLKKKGR